MYSFPFRFALSVFLLGTVRGYHMLSYATEAMMSVWTPPSEMPQVDNTPGSNALDPLFDAFGTSFGCCPDARWVMSSALLVRFGVLNVNS